MPYRLADGSLFPIGDGSCYIDAAFDWASKADSTAKLYYNDYGIYQTGTKKLNAVLNMVDRLQAEGVPIDGVGMQLHLYNNTYGTYNLTTLTNAMSAIKGKNIAVAVTELDDRLDVATANLSAQATAYGIALRACLNLISESARLARYRLSASAPPAAVRSRRGASPTSTPSPINGIRTETW